ncbi:MAG TPA: FmdB family zinc ribbon protein [Trueperaceae bacterium]|nr:FmdB family zinc ribbon protein [Trueperaceae bacterium]
MPIYVYKNLNTGETFEVSQRITEGALTEHPETGDPVKRIVQPVGIAFKGSGFYVTDNRSSSKGGAAKNGASKGDAPKGDAPKGDATKSDAPKSGTGTSSGASAD